MQTFKWLTDRCLILKFSKGKAAYLQNAKCPPRAYIVLYGFFEYTYKEMTSVDGVFGEKCGLGWTVGEEIVINNNC